MDYVLHAATKSWKIKVDLNIWRWAWYQWCQDSRIFCISRMNAWNKAIFSCWYKFEEAKSYVNNFLVGVVKNGHSQSGHGILKLAVSQEWVKNLVFVAFCACRWRFNSFRLDGWNGFRHGDCGFLNPQFTKRVQ